MSIQLPNLSNTIDSQLIDKSLAPPPHRRQKRNVNPPQLLEDYHLGAVGDYFNNVSSKSNFSINDDLTIGYAFPDYNSTVPSSSTNFIYYTTFFNTTDDVNLHSINFSTEFNASTPFSSSSLISSQFYRQLNINFNSPYNFQSISSYSIDDMQQDEINIFSDFAYGLISLDVGCARLNAAPTFDVLIQNMSPTFIYEAREAGYVSFDGYFHSVASSHADFHGPFLIHSIVASDVNVAAIHVTSATGSSQTKLSILMPHALCSRASNRIYYSRFG